MSDTLPQQSDQHELGNYLKYLRVKGWRSLWLISGDDKDWLQQTARALEQHLCITDCLWAVDQQLIEKPAPLGNTQTFVKQQVATKKITQRLGQEFQFVFFDAYTNFDANLLCIATGLVKAGGALIVLCPEVRLNAIPQLSSDFLLDYPAQKQQLNNYFFKRFVHFFGKAKKLL